MTRSSPSARLPKRSPRPQCRPDRRPSRRALDQHHDPRSCATRHRHPAQRALHRPADLEPAALCEGPADRQTPRSAQPAIRLAGHRGPGAGHRRRRALAGGTGPAGGDPAVAPGGQGPGGRVLASPACPAPADRAGLLRRLRLALAATGKDYLTCAAAHRQGTCSNKRSMRRPTLEALILDGLKDRLMAPDLVKEFIAEFHREVNRLSREREADLGLQRRELEEVSRKLRGLIEAIAEGLRGTRAPGQARRAGEPQGGARDRTRRRPAAGASAPSQPGRGLPAQGRRSASGARRPEHPDRGAGDPARAHRVRRAAPGRDRLRDRTRRRDRRHGRPRRPGQGGRAQGVGCQQRHGLTKNGIQGPVTACPLFYAPELAGAHQKRGASMIRPRKCRSTLM